MCDCKKETPRAHTSVCMHRPHFLLFPFPFLFRVLRTSKPSLNIHNITEAPAPAPALLSLVCAPPTRPHPSVHAFLLLTPKP
jgi:hypothetical protein